MLLRLILRQIVGVVSFTMLVDEVTLRNVGENVEEERVEGGFGDIHGGERRERKEGIGRVRETCGVQLSSFRVGALENGTSLLCKGQKRGKAACFGEEKGKKWEGL